jgi:hypothetical protein
MNHLRVGFAFGFVFGGFPVAIAARTAVSKSSGARLIRRERLMSLPRVFWDGFFDGIKNFQAV